MDTKSYKNWREHSAVKDSVAMTWSNDDITTLPWESTYMTDEIPKDNPWDTFATRSKRALEAMYAEWGVPKAGSLHYMSIRPTLTEGLKSIITPFANMKFNYNFLKLTPGCSLMWHFDTYATFVKYNDIDEQNVHNVCRTVVMTDDWDRGQILQVGNEVYKGWSAGDTYTWKGDTWHGMANFGPTDIVVSQITFWTSMTNIPNDKRSMDFGSAFAIQDPNTMRILRQQYDFTDLNNDSIIDEFVHEYDSWINSGTLNTFTGLEDYKFKCYSNGTTEAFDKFYMRNAKRRFRCFKGEYMYHKLAWRNNFDWQWLEDSALDKNDAVVISLPFADTGDKHNEYHNLMRDCSALGIPVLVDCAYYGACRHINIDIAYSCITDVTFSLSKTFPVAYARIGIRYTKVDDDDTMFVYHKISYNNKIGALIGLEYFKNFTPDYIPNKYIDKQKDFCNTLGVKTSKTVLFGIDDSKKYNQYNRGGNTNRLSFHKQYIRGLDIASKK